MSFLQTWGLYFWGVGGGVCFETLNKRWQSLEEKSLVKKTKQDRLVYSSFFGSLSEMTHVSVHVTEFNEYQHFLTVPSVLFLVLVPAPAFKKNQPLTFFPFLLPLLTISSSCGTQPDRSAFVNPWCNTTTVTSTRCSSFMMSPLLPALAAWLPG